jgi:phosphoglycolate phosphatase
VKPRVDLLMFDLDGTLADTGLDIANAVNHMRRRFDLAPLDNPAIYARVGRGVDHLIRAVLPSDQQDRFQESRRVFLAYYERHLLDNTRLYPHVREILDHFSQKKKVVISNKLRAPTLSILEGLGIAGSFDLILGGDSTLQRKPDPEPLNRALAHFAVQPGRAMMIGDDAGDILAGKAAGVVTCGVTYGLGNNEALIRSEPDLLIDDILALKDRYD